MAADRHCCYMCQIPEKSEKEKKSMNHKVKKVLRAMLLVLAMTLMYSINVPAATKVQASIGKKGYATLEKALAAVQDGQTITLKQDITLKQALVFNKNAKYAFNMNKHTITSKAPEKSNTGDLDIQAGSVTVTNGTLKGSVYAHRDATLTIKNGTYKQIHNQGRTTINNGKVISEDSTIFNWEGKMVINKVAAKSECCCVCVEGGTVIINGGSYTHTDPNSISPLILVESGRAFLKNGTYRAEDSDAVLNQYGSVTIYGGTYIGSDRSWELVYNHSSMTVKGGSFIKYNRGVALYCASQSKTVVTGGTLEGKYAAIDVEIGREKLLVRGSTLKAESVGIYCENTKSRVTLDKSKTKIEAPVDILEYTL